MRYATATAFRGALEQRLANTAANERTDLGRLRRRAVFERILARLTEPQERRWILKGGVALEIRLGNRARATKDLDLALVEHDTETHDVRDLLIEGLSIDVGDYFTFQVGPPREIAPDQAGRPGWRFSVTANLAGRRFQEVRVEVVARTDELTNTEILEVPTAFQFADLPSVAVETVDRRQHFGEKLHALTRSYGDRPNTRVKDLPDLLILISDGLKPTRELVEVVEHIFTVRGTHPMPTSIPDLPPAWARQYRDYALELDLDASDIDVAHGRLDDYWRKALQDAARLERRTETQGDE